MFVGVVISLVSGCTVLQHDPLAVYIEQNSNGVSNSYGYAQCLRQHAIADNRQDLVDALETYDTTVTDGKSSIPHDVAEQFLLYAPKCASKFG